MKFTPTVISYKHNFKFKIRETFSYNLFAENCINMKLINLFWQNRNRDGAKAPIYFPLCKH